MHTHRAECEVWLAFGPSSTVNYPVTAKVSNVASLSLLYIAVGKSLGFVYAFIVSCTNKYIVFIGVAFAIKMRDLPL